MTDSEHLRSGARLLVEALVVHGMDRAFCVPGESYLDVMDALLETSIELVVARHEASAGNMAEADGKLTGRCGICFVTRGPGATQASVALHTALQDSTPMILFIGLHKQSLKGREVFQEIDVAAQFGPTAKWAAEIPEAARVPEFVARAFRVAVAGRPGPVVLGLPENVLSTLANAQVEAPAPVMPAHAAPATIDALRARLAAASRPLVIVGGSGWTDTARDALGAFLEANDLPAVAGFRRQDLVDNMSASYVGHLTLGIDPELARRVREADLIVALGSRIGEITSGDYGLLDAPYPRQTFVHVHPDPEEIGRVYQPALPIVLRPAELPSLLDPIRLDAMPWHGWREEARARYVAFSTPPETRAEGPVDLAPVIAALGETLGADTIITNGAGNYTVWGHRFHRFARRVSQVAPTSGAMGYGLPAAIAAKLRFPARPVVCLAGDGCFQMCAQELATAMQFAAPVIVVLINNGMYGTIRMHQERHFPGRVIGTPLHNPDFVAFAHSFGAYAERVASTASFAPALERAHASGRAALLEIIADPRQLTPSMRIP